MNQQALARTWRPKTISEVIGQDHITKAITHSLSSSNIHHAYLFTGTRGVGKTSLGRILAKSLNCQQGISPTPCGKCDSCIGVTQGNHPDLIEIDAASRTKVEDTREVLEHIQFMPSSGRFKVYLIDEVHMLSGHSFNALLKTLEEPPEHVRFILATTDPQKLPETIISRCLHFHLNSMTPAILIQQLKHILTHEKVNFDDESLALIARHAKGSMRDALSLTEKLIHFCQSNLNIVETSKCLGTMPKKIIESLGHAILNRDLVNALALTESFQSQNIRYELLIQELMIHLHETLKESALKGSKTYQDEAIQMVYQMAQKAYEDLPYAPSPNIGFEMMIIRMVHFQPQSCDIPYEKIEKLPDTPSIKLTKPPQKNNINLSELLESNPIQGLMKQIIEQSTLESNQDTLILSVQSSISGLLTADQKSNISKWIHSCLNTHLPVNFVVSKEVLSTPNQQKIEKQHQQKSDLYDSLSKDPDIQAIVKTFKTTLDKGNIQP